MKRRVLLPFSFHFLAVALLLAETAPEQRLTQFIESPPAIKEMVVECNWFRHMSGTTDTNWIALCWQTNGYVLRNSVQRVGLYDKFDTNNDRLITVRLGNMYSAITWYKQLGTHIEQVEGNSNAGKQDIVTPKIRAQEAVVADALSVGIPAPAGTLRMTNRAFRHRDEALHRTLSGVMMVAQDGIVTGFSMTNEIDRTEKRDSSVIPLELRYGYGRSLNENWFPEEITRDAVISNKVMAICRLIVHRLELGYVPSTEFSPDRFIAEPSGSRIVTSNHVSYITLKGITKAVADPDLLVKEARMRKHRTIYLIAFMAISAGALVVIFAGRGRKAMM